MSINTSSPQASYSSHQNLSQSQDENNFPILSTNNSHTWPDDQKQRFSSTRESARKKPSLLSHSTRGVSAPSSSSSPLSVTNLQSPSRLNKSLGSPSVERRNSGKYQSGEPPLPPRGMQIDSPKKTLNKSTNSPRTPTTAMREPIAVPSPSDHRHALTPRTNQSAPPRTDLYVESSPAMTSHGRRGRVPTETIQDSIDPRNGRNPRNSKNQTRQTYDSPSVHSQASGPTRDWQWEQNNDPDDQEQALFEQRLCEDIYGVAVRKINQNGKSNLRYVKCSFVDAAELDVDSNGFSSSRSISSRSRGFASRFTGRDRSLERNESVEHESQRSFRGGKKVRVLTWGKKKDVKIPIERFVCVRKGKTTDRARRNICPASRILSLITDDPYQLSLDIEAPTKLDRDKFARAFSRFLRIPLEGDDMRSVRSDMTPQSVKDGKKLSQRPPSLRQHSVTANSSQDVASGAHTTNSHATSSSRKHIPLPIVTTDHGSAFRKSGLPPARGISSNKARMMQSGVSNSSFTASDHPDPQIGSLHSRDSNADMPVHPSRSASAKTSEKHGDQSHPGTPGIHLNADEEGSVVSSITGAGFDQEIVEELHMALTDLRAELEESRAEAARAVKVAEQAIQSAENSSSKDWNSTVTHKAAEAAALAQKRSAEAMAKARFAEERLEGERKNASIWRKQAESAEAEAGHWQTRAAAAEVQRAAMAQNLESEREKASMLISQPGQIENSALIAERNRALEAEVQMLRQSLSQRNSEVASLHDCLSEGESSSEAYRLLAKRKPNLAALTKNSNDRDGAANALLSSSNNFSPVQEFRQTLTGIAPSPNTTITNSDKTILASQMEMDRLRAKLAMESASRRKLLHEVQDLRGNVRVYCRPMPAKGTSIVSAPSREILLLNRKGFKTSGANSFHFDGILTDDMGQQDVYDELDEVCLSALDGYNVCIMVYGPTKSGKTRTLLGDIVQNNKMAFSVENYGLHLRAVQQYFSVLKHRSERYQDIVSFSVLEVHNERLCDLLAGTEIGETSGRIEGLKKNSRRRLDSHDGSATSMASRTNKLEIRTNHNGETVVNGQISVEVSCFEDVLRIWKECLKKRRSQLAETGMNVPEHESRSHLIITLKVFSTNISTGVGTTGKIQFVDLAASDGSPAVRRSNSKVSTPESTQSGLGSQNDWNFSNKSLSTLNDVVRARAQFQRSVPYRNSTITHLLSDSLEADTKVVMLACVSSDPKDLQETTATLNFAQTMRKVVIGKATKHTLSHA